MSLSLAHIVSLRAPITDPPFRARTGFDSLRSIHAEDPNLAKQIELYIDGGVRRGTDVLQAIALGAKGVGLGRTFLWAQAAYGEKGVIRAIRSESEPIESGKLVVMLICRSHGE